MNADDQNIVVPVNNICVYPRSSAVPVPRVAIAIRVATMADLPFMDGLQKQHSKALGYFPTKQFEGYIEMGGVLVAWATRPCESDDTTNTGGSPVPLGYVISRDRYLKRDELGVIYQLCVVPGDQRKLVGASLIKEVFERSAYGCRLYCCWCAQDLDANYFWESLGFVPIAFRGGSGKKKRVHIFWQKRIRAGDTTTPWWFPSKTDQGAMREDRLVLPIPPGLHWRDPMPVLEPLPQPQGQPSPSRKRVKVPEVGSTGGPQAPTPRPRAGARFGPPPTKPEPVETKPARADAAREKTPREKKKCDPKLIAAARELRDRALEHYNGEHDDPLMLRAPVGKYDVTRALSDATPAKPMPLLKAG
jgi:hypothetical protein